MGLVKLRLKSKLAFTIVYGDCSALGSPGGVFASPRGGGIMSFSLLLDKHVAPHRFLRGT